MLIVPPIEARGGRTVHEVCDPAAPAVPLAGVEPGAVGGVRDQVPLGVSRHSSTDLVVD